jgi:hypothetical protein
MKKQGSLQRENASGRSPRDFRKPGVPNLDRSRLIL